MADDVGGCGEFSDPFSQDGMYKDEDDPICQGDSVGPLQLGPLTGGAAVNPDRAGRSSMQKALQAATQLAHDGVLTMQPEAAVDFVDKMLETLKGWPPDKPISCGALLTASGSPLSLSMTAKDLQFELMKYRTAVLSYCGQMTCQVSHGELLGHPDDVAFRYGECHSFAGNAHQI